MIIKQLVLLALAGGLGTLARYGLTGVVQQWCGIRFPLGTLAVNLLGCFLFGLVWNLAETRLWIDSQTRLIVLTGFLGALTTFSTFAFETSNELQNGEWRFALLNVAAQNFLGIACVLLGFALGKNI